MPYQTIKDPDLDVYRLTAKEGFPKDYEHTLLMVYNRPTGELMASGDLHPLGADQLMKLAQEQRQNVIARGEHTYYPYQWMLGHAMLYLDRLLPEMHQQAKTKRVIFMVRDTGDELMKTYAKKAEEESILRLNS